MRYFSFPIGNLLPAYLFRRGNSSTPSNADIIKELMKETNLLEKFVKGSGRGGQKINKNLSCVQLKHIPTGIFVETQRFRELMNNRKEARKLLALQLDVYLHGQESKIMKKITLLQKKKAKKASRAKEKYGDGEKKETSNSQRSQEK